MKYFHLQNEANPLNAFVENMESNKKIIEKINKGISFQDDPPELTGYISKKSGMKMPDMFPDGTYFLVSEKMKRLLESAESEFLEFYPATITDRRVPEKFIYYLVNILTRCDAMDRSRTEAEWSPSGTPLKIHKLVLDENKIGKRTIFQILPISKPVFIHEKIKNLLESEGITGIQYIPVEEYTFGKWW